MQPEQPYPLLSLPCTSAPAFTSAIAVSVWPLSDALCSAVILHSQNRRSLQLHPRVDGPSALHCDNPTDTTMQAREP